MSFAPQVTTIGEGDTFYGNALRFATREEAEANVADLAQRWIRVTGTRVIESTDPVNYRWTADEGTVHVEAL
jgi:hypothetical protein